MESENNIFNIFEGCVPVKGFARSIIYDLQREEYDFIPNDLVDFIAENNGKTLEQNNDNDEINSYIDFLLEKEYAFYCNENELSFFTPISLEWDFPSHITSAAIDLGIGWSKKNVKLLLEQLSEVKCHHLQIYTTDTIHINDLSYLLRSVYNSGLRSIEVIMPYYAKIKKGDIAKLLWENKRITNLIFFNAKENKVFEDLKECIFLSQDLKMNGCIDLGYFQANLLMFCESKKYNTFFNRKVFLDREGNIKNYPTQDKVFGNISNENLHEVTQKSSFQELWRTQKDEIDVCSTCEFRYMCLDPRIPEKRIDGSWFYKKECNYNPYIAKWKGEDGYRSLGECGIIVNEEKIVIDFLKIGTILSELYSN